MIYWQPHFAGLPMVNGAMGAASLDHSKHGDALQSEEILPWRALEEGLLKISRVYLVGMGENT